VDAPTLDSLMSYAAETEGDPVAVPFVSDGVRVRITSVGTSEIAFDAEPWTRAVDRRGKPLTVRSPTVS